MWDPCSSPWVIGQTWYIEHNPTDCLTTLCNNQCISHTAGQVTAIRANRWRDGEINGLLGCSSVNINSESNKAPEKEKKRIKQKLYVLSLGSYTTHSEIIPSLLSTSLLGQLYCIRNLTRQPLPKLVSGGYLARWYPHPSRRNDSSVKQCLARLFPRTLKTQKGRWLWKQQWPRKDKQEDFW